MSKQLPLLISASIVAGLTGGSLSFYRITHTTELNGTCAGIYNNANHGFPIKYFVKSTSRYCDYPAAGTSVFSKTAFIANAAAWGVVATVIGALLLWKTSFRQSSMLLLAVVCMGGVLTLLTFALRSNGNGNGWGRFICNPGNTATASETMYGHGFPRSYYVNPLSTKCALNQVGGDSAANLAKGQWSSTDLAADWGIWSAVGAVIGTVVWKLAKIRSEHE